MYQKSCCSYVNFIWGHPFTLPHFPRWRRPSWMMRTTVLQRPPCYWRHTPSKPNMVTTAKMCTSLGTLRTTDCCLRGTHWQTLSRFMWIRGLKMVNMVSSLLEFSVVFLRHWILICLFAEFWNSTNSLRSSGRTGYRPGMRNTEERSGTSLLQESWTFLLFLFCHVGAKCFQS